MEDATQAARVTALWVVHGNSLANLLRHHGRPDHADNLNAALGEVAEILSGQIGRDALTEAMIWASDQIWSQENPAEGSLSRN